MKSKIILLALIIITAITFSACSEEAIEPSSIKKSEGGGVVVHDEF